MKTHKLSQTRIYKCWQSMKQRCGNPKASRYLDYGGRGVTYTNRWEIFENFYKDMSKGYSDNLTLDRKNVNKDYCKENCRWVPNLQQQRNKQNSFYIKFKGKKITVGELAEITGLELGYLKNRLYLYKWTVERAITTPKRKLTKTKLKNTKYEKF